MLYFITRSLCVSLRNYNLELFVKQAKLISSKGNVLYCSKRQEVENIGNEYDDIGLEEKIVYNSIIKHGRVPEIKKEDALLYEERSVQYKTKGPPVLALKYFTNQCTPNEQKSNSKPSHENENKRIDLPFGRYHHVVLNNTTDDKKHEIGSTLSEEHKELPFNYLIEKSCSRPKKKWMKDYEKYTEVSIKQNKEEEEGDKSDSWNSNYGSADPKVPESSVPCGGCGANLHCQDTAIPGYLPKEIFVGLTEEQLQAVVCQRCHFLREYNTALSVSVNPEVYPQLLSKIKTQNALVILVVDMTDFPCSIWPGIMDVIGPKRPLVVVGNKIDLLQDWSEGWLERAKQALIRQLPPKANLLHVTLVSAKTGYGIERLISSLYRLWEYRGDVYLVGCTNVGKSTLFNSLLQSDYCKTKAVDLIQRATTAPWPGTTLNLLKFPITRPDGWRLATRSSRLKENVSDPGQNKPQMISHISRTFAHGLIDNHSDEYWDDPFALPKLSTLRRLKAPGSGLDVKDPVFVNSKWLYDTPGVVTPDQMISLLTTEELMLTLPCEPLVPRTFQLWPLQSLMLAGLGRIDYLKGPANIKLTVMASRSLPVTICAITDAEAVYRYYLDSPVLAVPCGGQERLKLWPGLAAAPPFVLKGEGWRESCADVVLSSAGWAAVTANQDSICQLQAWTPQARGIYVRCPPVLPRAIALKGTKLYGTQSYALFNKNIKKRIRK